MERLISVVVKKILVFSIRRPLVKESGFLSFAGTVPFLCAYVPPTFCLGFSGVSAFF